MNKSELIDALAEKKGLTYKKAEEIVNIVLDTMSDTLISGGRNPKTGEEIEVKPKKLPFFKVGKELRERINNS